MLTSQLSKKFLANFPAQLSHRTVGREAEHPVVHPNGEAADISVLWPLLTSRGQFNAVYEGDLLVALEGEDFTFSSEVGKGTIEIITTPKGNLHQLKGCYESARDLLLAAAADANLRVLGYGIQPKTPPTPKLMTPKQRYGVLLDVLGPDWLWFCLTASDQIHVAIAASEFVKHTNVGNLLAPLTIALCANSPIFSGKISPWLSAREGGMGRIHSEYNRHGLPDGPIHSPQDYIDQMVALPHLLLKRDGKNFPQTGRFASFLSSAEPSDVDGIFDDFLHHEHYVWHSARPRSAHGTIELRSAGQQPPDEHMAVAALSLGIVEAADAISERLEREFADQTWPTMRHYHHEVVHHGMAATEPSSGLIRSLLDLIAEGLERRGLGEETFIQPLYTRLAERSNPAQRAVKAFEVSGMEGILDIMCCR